MRIRRTVYYLTALAVVAGLLQGREAGILPFHYRHIQLENGLRAYLIQTDSPGQIAFVTIVRSGSRDEYEPGKSGYAHFFEHMMFRGTERYPSYGDQVGRIGALSNAATTDDYTQFYLEASSEVLERIIDLESDRFMNLDYTERQFRTEAGAVLGEFSLTWGNPYNHLIEAIQDTAFERHPYKHLTIGFEQDVRALPDGYAHSLNFYRRYYRPENCVLLLAGDFDPDHAAALIRRHYAPWERGYCAPEIESEPEQTAPRRTTVHFPGRALPMLSVDYRGPAWNAADRMSVAAEVLGRAAFGPRSELYKELVVKDQTVRSLTVDFGLRRDPSLLEVMAVVPDSSRLSAVETLIGRTAARFRSDLCDAGMIDDVTSAMKYEFLMSMDTALGVCFALRPSIVSTGGIEAFEDYARTLEGVTPEDVRAAARAYLVESGKTTVTLLPAEGDAR